MSRFWIDIEDSSGNKYGPGPIANAQSLEVVRRLDRAGKLSFPAPASDIRSGYIAEKRTVRAFTAYNRQVVELGAGIIDEITVQPNDLTLKVAGDDLLRELSYRQVGSLTIDDGAGGPDTSGPADIIAQAPAGWSLDTNRGFNATMVSIQHVFEGETVLNAFVRLAEITGEHFYLGTGRKVVWIRETGSAKLIYTPYFGTFVAGEIVTGFTSGASGTIGEVGSGWLYVTAVSGSFLDGETITGGTSSAQGTIDTAYNPKSGIRAVQGGDPVAIESNPNVCLITDLQEVRDTYETVSRIYPYGSGDGSARVTLSGTSWTPPSGYTLDAANNYIKNNSAETNYGQIERTMQFKDISDKDTLAQAAYSWLRQNSQPVKSYRLAVTGLQQEIQPGQSIRVIYHRWMDGFHAINIDADLLVLETTTKIDDKGIRTVGMQVATIDRWPVSDVGAIVGGLSQAQASYTHTQPVGGDVLGAHTHLFADITNMGKGARAYNSTTISHTTSATWQAVALDSERFDTDNCHDLVTNNSRLTCQTAGKYAITAHLAFASNTTGTRAIAVRLNGSTFLANHMVAAFAGTCYLSVATIYDLAAGDYIELVAYQSSGGALNINASPNYSPELAMERIG